MADPTTDTSGATIPAADPSTPFPFTATATVVYCDICGVALANGDQVVGNGQAGTPYRHAACNTLTYRVDVPLDPNAHTRT
jgi:hypothetical protein